MSYLQEAALCPWTRPVPWGWRRLPWWLLVALAGWWGLLVTVPAETWVHHATGQAILDEGIPQSDALGWFHQQNSTLWVDVHWGYQLVLVGLDNSLGPVGWRLLTAGLLALTVLAGLSSYRPYWPTWVPVWVWTITLLSIGPGLQLSPELFRLVCATLFVVILLDAERSPATLWALPVIQVVWSNTDQLFVMGPLLLSAHYLEALLRLEARAGRFAQLIPVVILTFAACAVSPYRQANVFFALSDGLPQLMGWTTGVPNLGLTTRDAQVGGLIHWARSANWSMVWLGALSRWHELLMLTLAVLSSVSALVALRAIFVDRRIFGLLALILFAWVGWGPVHDQTLWAVGCAVLIGRMIGQTVETPYPAGRWVLCLQSALVAGVLLMTMAGRTAWLIGDRPHDGCPLQAGPTTSPQDLARPLLPLLDDPAQQPRSARVWAWDRASSALVRSALPRAFTIRTITGPEPQLASRQFQRLHDQAAPGQWVFLQPTAQPEPAALFWAHPQWRCLLWTTQGAIFQRVSNQSVEKNPSAISNRSLPGDADHSLEKRPAFLPRLARPTDWNRLSAWGLAEPLSIDYHRGRSALRLCKAFVWHAKPDPMTVNLAWKALDFAQNAVQAQPNRPEPRRLLISTLRIFQQLESKPSTESFFYECAEFQRRLLQTYTFSSDRPAEAIALLYQESLETPPASPADFIPANADIPTDQAKQKVESAVVARWMLQSRFFLARGDYEQARQSFQRILAVAPHDEQAAFGLALSYRLMQNREQARRVVSSLRVLSQDNPDWKFLDSFLSKTSPAPVLNSDR